MPAGSIEQKFIDSLTPFIEAEKAELLPKYFQVFAGGYGEGDRFLGVRVPNVRKTAKAFYAIDYGEIVQLLHSPWHEVRLGALFILVHRYSRIDEREYVVDCYLNNLPGINNWDLVDSSAHKILGEWTLEKQDSRILLHMTRSHNIWHRRIAVISTFAYIRAGKIDETLLIAKRLLHDEHDLIHKAVGWVLREVGKADLEALETFLNRHAGTMPRTMLRYAIEKLPQEKRKMYLAMKNGT